VATNVKYHSSQEETSLFIVTNAFRSTNHKAEAADLAEMTEVVTEAAVTTEVQETTDHEKCTKQHVVTVATNVKYHSSQRRTDLFIVRNASQIIEEIKARLYFHILWIK
jgi:UDP-N-acetyl-D-mannosaminuronate dehydrogenase